MIRARSAGPAAVALLAGLATAQAEVPEPPAGAPAGIGWIERDGLRAHAELLASDELGGRYTGTDGQRRAAQHIAEHFEKLGIQPLGDRQAGRVGYTQGYPLEATQLDPSTSIAIGQDAVTTGFAVVPGRRPAAVKITGPFAFCGDGSPEDLPSALGGAIPLVVLRDEATGPRAEMGSVRTMQRAAAVNKALARKGARAAVFLLLDETPLLDQFNARALLPGKPLLAFEGNPGRRFADHEVPSVFCSKALSEPCCRTPA